MFPLQLFILEYFCQNHLYNWSLKISAMSGKPLVVIIDEEARSNLEPLNFRWFGQGRKQNDQSYLVETPIGEQREVRGTLIRSPNLRSHAQEYVYLELTPVCNFSCRHCGVRNTLDFTRNFLDESVSYLTGDFLTLFLEAMPVAYHDTVNNTHSSFGLRNVFFGGGEPLIAPNKFRRVKDLFDELENTRSYVATNGVMLPLDKQDFIEFMERLDNPYLVLSCSESHINQYARLAVSGDHSKYVPYWGNPREAFIHKAELLQSYCDELEIGFKVNVVDSGSKELRSRIIKSAHNLNVFETTVDGTRIPCSQGQELSIRANGNVYPHCYDIFNGHNKLGVMGLLVE